MIQRKIGENGRITLPKEMLDKHNIKKDDILAIYEHQDHIAIKKYEPEYVCVITGKITSEGKRIGKSFISYEGLEMIRQFLNENPKN